MIKQEIWKRIAGIAVALLLLISIYMIFTGYFVRVRVSLPAGRYDEDIQITASTVRSSEIYYTLDGSEPSAQNENAHVYKEPISIKAEDEEQVQSIKWKAYFSNGATSDTLTHTYIVGKAIEERYSTMVVSVTTDPDNLYGYENGIFVEGKIRDEYMKEHPDEEPDAFTPANYNVRGSASERSIYVEMFDEEGKRVIAQDCGIRTGGDFSRGSEQKPFRLFAREELYGNDYFDYNFFPEMDEISGQLNGITKYNTLFFRNSGNDRQEAYIRDEVAQDLARQNGFLDTQYFRPACVYINGEYAGFFWMHSQYNQTYFKQRYGKYSGDMVVIGDSETELNTTTEDALSNYYAAEYMELYQYYAAQDLTDDAVFESLNTVIDVENYLQYYALQIYFGNLDWPTSNEQAYRYVSTKRDYMEGTVFDGRYRYLLYDVDTSLGRGHIAEDVDPWTGPDKLQNLLDGEDAPLFKALMKRTDCQQYFTRYMCEFIDTTCSYENVCKTVDALDASRRQELDHYIEVLYGYKPGEFKYLDMQLDTIKAWGQVSGDAMKYKLQELWGFVEM